jgi:hypothetical protein
MDEQVVIDKVLCTHDSKIWSHCGDNW